MMYPKIAGLPIYPGGLPVSADSCSFEDKTARELYFLNGEGKTDPIQDEMLKSYMIYYLGAPLFENELTAEIIAKDLEKMSIEDLMAEMLSCGLDPF